MQKGFSIIELLIVLAILMILLAISIPNITSLVKNPQVKNTSEEVVNILKLAQNKTLSSDGNSQYGVYFEITASPHQYILFKGSSFATRDTAYDKIYSVPTVIEFSTINLGGGNEIVFNRVTGTTQNTGNISVRLKDDTSQTKTIYIDNFGGIGFTAPLTPSDANRINDSRHIDFDYSRVINTATENIVLTFNGSTVVTIPIASYLNNGQFEWQGTTNVGGVNQTITIHTLRLNNPDTQFSVFRDMRLNDKSLAITISGDTSGTLAEYTANGAVTNFYSIYVNNFAWQ